STFAARSPTFVTISHFVVEASHSTSDKGSTDVGFIVEAEYGSLGFCYRSEIEEAVCLYMSKGACDEGGL
ncbi:hypothetical protein, partial [Alkalibacillus haloalkaliphilus]|uniref:hypothetical protein n=1 Tax=Alkalibacillus haloalkaliphilus TaxID=94136 RepID=UPI0029366734